MFKEILILSFLLVSFLLFAGNTNDIINLKQGQIAPFDGKLITDEKLDQLIEDSINRKKMELLVERLEQQIKNEQKLKDEAIYQNNQNKIIIVALESKLKDIQKRNDFLEKRHWILVISGGVGWGIAGGETAAALIVGLLYYTLK